MKINKIIREEMLETLKDLILEADGNDADAMKIIFSNGSTDLCEVGFKDIILYTLSSSSARYRFQASDDSYLLRSVADSDGTVSEFRIIGRNNPGTTPATYGTIITGTVGNLITSADITFNMINWVDGTFISIENLDFTLPDGV